ncbi:HAD-IB family hydrolase [Marinobacter daepoensis]|uniref:HAD family hydrolase n=1 Tax=Marinobacter daepoensis TaxID=262077 RepID=A0ABS3BG05_9GAMM|nr:HAD family hydrolase [Marinobacter daepoensis]MBN7769791.1 HAD family hydrolase [Marinobacter daepoensis]MBY6078481.1 HAD-IB family hydrolase [Marinobacter daepoensis]
MLAVFDLDETLIHGDSSHLFTAFLRQEAIDTDPDAMEQDRAFLSDYQAGKLDLQAYMEFSLAPLRGWQREQLEALVGKFVNDIIAPRVLPTGKERIAWHRAQGHRLLIISATGEHLVAPIARYLGLEDGIGVQVEWQNNSLTGRIGARRPFREGKISALDEWLKAQAFQPEKTWFYSDSHNDLPLLNTVDYPVAINPDTRLQEHAQHHGWRILNDALRPS